MQAISIIKTEHRNLAALLFTLGQLLQDIEQHGSTVPFKVFHGIIYYLDSFLDRYHHPKENRYLFPIVQHRHPAAAPLIQQLGREHVEGERLLNAMVKTLSAYEYLGPAGLGDFSAAVHRYVDFERRHAQTEEQEILPLASTYLEAADWETIDQAFLDNADPLFGASPTAEFHDLFSDLTNLVPAPWGFGPASKA